MDAKEKTKANFDKNADTYDTGSFYKYPRDCHPHVLREIETMEFHSLLDLGCGTGVILKSLCDKYPDVKFAGLDISEKMLSKARERVGAKADLTLGDAENLPYPDDSFDLVTCSESFHHYPNPQKVFSGVRRVLRKGGKFILCDTWVLLPFRVILNALFRFGNRGDVRLYSRREIIALLREAGFHDIQWRLITYHAYLCRGSKYNHCCLQAAD